MDDYATLMDSVRDAYPDEGFTAYEVFESGQHNTLLLVNEELVFRFPRHRNDYPVFTQEIRLLEALREQLPIPIPDPLFQGKVGSNGRPFVGYKKLPGKPLGRAVLGCIQNPSTRKRLARQVSTFLIALHAPETARISGLSVSKADTRQQYVDLYDTIREKLYQHMNSTARESISGCFGSHLESKENFSYVPCLRHGDFGPTNILINDDGNEISAVLDFAYAGLGDPAYDLAGVSCLGGPFLELVAEDYPDFDGLRHRIDFYKKTFALQEALFGFEHNDSAAFERGIEAFR